jgi:hypothetical protein
VDRIGQSQFIGSVMFHPSQLEAPPSDALTHSRK